MRHAALLLLLSLAACHPRPATPAPPPPGLTTPPPGTEPAPGGTQGAPGGSTTGHPDGPPDGQSPASASGRPAGPAPARPVTLVVGGDVTVGYHYEEYFDAQVAQGRSREEMFAYGLREVMPIVDSGDLFVVNLECPYTDSTQKLPKNFNFKARPELVNVLTAGRVGVVSLANNHMMDYGAQGLLDTLTALEAARIPYFGAGRTLAEARRPALLDVGGQRIAFLGYFFLGSRNIEPPQVYATDTTPGVAGHFSDVEVMERMLREDIAAAKARADLVLPFFHWGIEGNTTPEPYQVRLAHAAIDAGAAGVLGSHPHVLQSMELYRGRPVLYSLGNFVFGGNWNPRDKRSVLWRARFDSTGYLSSDVLPLRTDRYPEFPVQPVPVTGAEAEGVMTLLRTASQAPGLERMLPALEAGEPGARPLPSSSVRGGE
ncbi:CapA family protein [Corallococcus sp. Z5C101001]|uniref:CapA family protein n=1 Tax=Corallococcus sp. Z5C101001 TaxID=2596829 RepID=UPI00117D17B4|nr:CapA family protein [Corallococcus sp. Z5C101001]TSC23328.1 CapA family protein [Corallococcus sp. Z5C101001]